MKVPENQIKVIDAIKQALKAVDEQKKQNGNLKIPLSQLEIAEKTLRDTINKIELNEYLTGDDHDMAGLGHMVVDQWPYELEISNIVLRAVQIYHKLRMG